MILLGWPRIEGRENLRGWSGPLLVVCNHIDDVDAGFVQTALPARLRNRIATATGGEALEALRTPAASRGWFLGIYDRVQWVLGVSLLNLFPLPREAGFPGLLGDPRIWTSLVTVVVLAAAFALVAPSFVQGSGKERRRWVAVLTAISVTSPLIAFPLTVGVTDPPIIAFTCLTLALAARMLSGASINGTAAVGVVLGHVRRDLHFSQVSHQLLRVIILVSAQRHLLHTRNL